MITGVMQASDSTCWTLIQAAASGDAQGRDHIARRYEPPVRAYFRSRWKTNAGSEHADDAVQEVFLECFKEGGALEKIASARTGGFRAFLQAVARNVALRIEERRAKALGRRSDESRDLDRLATDQSGPEAAFDRSWATEMVKEAARLMDRLAQSQGEAARRRVELLTLRFYDGLAIREIATLWNVEPARLHHDYALARQEFQRCLTRIVAFHQSDEPDLVETECRRLIQLLAAP